METHRSNFRLLGEFLFLLSLLFVEVELMETHRAVTPQMRECLKPVASIRRSGINGNQGI